PRRRALGPDAAAAAASGLGFPVVVKRDGPAHKSRDGGVLLGLADEAAVRSAAERLGGSVLVGAQVPPGLEVYCGMSRDPDVGPVLAIGLGGAAVERLPAGAVCIAPIRIEDARRMVDEAQVVSAGLSAGAVEALAQIVVAVGRLAIDHPEISAVDVNPLLVRGDGAVAVDALVVVGGAAS